MAKPRTQKKKPAPIALVKNATKVATAARKTHEVRARELVAEVRDKLGVAASAFYAIGVALVELSVPSLVTALGYRTCGALVKTELGISRDWASEMMAVARGMKRSTALSLGLTRAAAVVELAAATPEHDTPEQLAKGKVVVRGHHAPLRPEQMSARQIRQAAQVERRSHKKKDVEVAARVAELQALLVKKDPHASVTLVTTRPKGGTPTPTLKLSASLAAFEAVFGKR